MRDFEHDRKKNLDLVLCTPAAGNSASTLDLVGLMEKYQVVLSEPEKGILASLPSLKCGPVGSVLMALEAKACMTAHQRALPRLYDELNSSHLTVHGATDQAIAAGFVMINSSDRYVSPDLNKGVRGGEPVWSIHRQPRDATLAIDKVHQIPRRARVGDVGFDAMAITVIECANDGSPVVIVDGPPSPPKGDIYEYESFIHRLNAEYSTRFREL
jgi:hypothetical protein